jgi:hypothetical protein
MAVQRADCMGIRASIGRRKSSSRNRESRRLVVSCAAAYALYKGTKITMDGLNA